MASISGAGSSSSFATVFVNSDSGSAVTLTSISFLPGLTAHRKVRVTGVIGAEAFETIFELLDEVFEQDENAELKENK